VQNFATAEVHTFPFGRFETCQVGEYSIGRARYEPGWRWSRDVGPSVGTALCEVGHVGVVIEGQAGVRMADGREFVIRAGDAFVIEAGHDSWVVGDEPYVSIHLANSGPYAASGQ
jgi:hypothetical protein